MKGMFRTGWQMDYPSIENFLAPLYKTGASSNDGKYSNPAFDKLINEAAARHGRAEANALYQQAEAILGQDMPAIPMYYRQDHHGLVRQDHRCEDHRVRDGRLHVGLRQVRSWA